MTTQKKFLIRKFIFVPMLLFMFTSNAQLLAKQQDTNKPEDFFEMSIEQLMEVEVTSTATLTDTKPRLVPAAVTTITEEQIQASGARSLFELLDIYVPNLQWTRNAWEPENMGLRGIMTDRDDKYLLLVNGRVMNERTHYGVVSERDMPMLKDIHHIDVVRGPGSALYGPGAVSMVINIITHNASTFEGTDITTRIGVVEEFYSTEIRHGRKFKDGDGGIFAYAGIGKYRGADKYDAPLIVPGDTSGLPNDPYTYREGGHLLHPSLPNDGEAYRGLPPLKFYAELTRGSWDIWARYTRSGKQFVWDTGTLFCQDWQHGWGNQLPYEDSGYGYQQLTGFIGKSMELGPKTALDMSFSYDLLDYQRVTDAWTRWFNEVYREDKYIGKVVLKHEFNKRHKVAVGTEVLHGEYGQDPISGYPDRPAKSDKFASMPQWSTNIYSVLGEYQWTINNQWTAFLGARIDDHTYTDEMFSPRAAMVFTPNDKDTVKAIWSRSVRANYEEEMKASGDPESRPEKLDSIELRYERKHNKNLDLAVSFFMHYNLEIIGFDGTTQSTIPLATQRQWGFELEAAYHTDKTRVAISHSYTDLYAFSLAAPNIWTSISAMGYGYGNDYARWSNHISKVTAQHKLDDRWTVDGSMRIYWGFPGHKDFIRYVHDSYAAGTNWPDSPAAPGWERTYRAVPYLNLGLQYQPTKNLTIRADGYYLLGIFKEDLNKRIYGSNNAVYRCHAPAVAFSLIYKF